MPFSRRRLILQSSAAPDELHMDTDNKESEDDEKEVERTKEKDAEETEEKNKEGKEETVKKEADTKEESKGAKEDEGKKDEVSLLLKFLPAYISTLVIEIKLVTLK